MRNRYKTIYRVTAIIMVCVLVEFYGAIESYKMYINVFIVNDHEGIKYSCHRLIVIFLLPFCTRIFTFETTQCLVNMIGKWICHYILFLLWHCKCYLIWIPENLCIFSYLELCINPLFLLICRIFKCIVSWYQSRVELRNKCMGPSKDGPTL